MRAMKTVAHKKILASVRQTLKTEQEGLKKLCASLTPAWAHAVTLMENTRGRVIVSGMGKSGHVGRKIAATLASTGTPAQFVHPAEASHGDLGMITSEDVLLLLSVSGETQELKTLVDYAARFAIPLIAITANPNSALAGRAQKVLLLPDVPEAAGLAPTTSTTMQLALGDALAVALLERKGFTPTQFETFHPGGQLGTKLRRVHTFMHTGKSLPLCAPNTLMSQVLLTMSEKGFGCVGILSTKNTLAGIITDGDLRRHMAPDLLTKPARAIMTKKPTTVPPSALAGEVLRLLNEKKITSVFVVDKKPKTVRGLVHVHDLLTPK